jgi:hypothetical protein
VPAASAILDRLLHHAEIIAINGSASSSSNPACFPFSLSLHMRIEVVDQLIDHLKSQESGDSSR